ncbi:hypothetical protein TRFO_01626 [Tritrichomonas foetus]|uniref:Uncharacterized protein n=1 Tax=Tritrichomonas foetus TaxID=1144522 RepID=A0A1J4JRK3_9EUKA|nr:hypothetical protein TRFO_01626 [Tritrichomonas foetus]|eukprot:OHT01064.1 hypothetical protein TRFO_01626 [Tritrichomonas foetus]
MRKIKLGIFPESSILLGNRPIGCVLPINAHEMIATTEKDIYRFEGDDIKESAPYSFSCACHIPGVDLIVAHTYRGSELWVMKTTDLKHPILSGFNSGHMCVYHILYSAKSKSVIIIGAGVRVFTISWNYTGARLLTSNSNVNFTFRSSFADEYDTTILNPPTFDYENEYLFLPTPEGVRPFTLDGFECKLASKLPADISTVFAFETNTRKLITSDATNGICLWKKNGNIKKRIDLLSAAILAIGFIDSENVVCLSASFSLYLLNVKTGRSFLCHTSDRRPTRFLLTSLHSKPIIALCRANRLSLYRIFIPWHVWNLNTVRPSIICRCPKINSAARILVLTDNSFVKLDNPRKSCQLTAATPSETTYPSSFFYDRGVFLNYIYNDLYNSFDTSVIPTDSLIPHDNLYLIYQNGTICNFNPNSSPSEEYWTKSINARFMTIVLYKEKWCYAIAHFYGFLSIIDTDSFETIRYISVSKETVKFMLYHHNSKSLLFMMKKEIKIFSLEKEHFTFKMPINPTELGYVHGDVLYLGDKKGYIHRYKITSNYLDFIEPEIIIQPHNAAVTSIDFSPNYYISSSLDKTVVIWNYVHVKLTQIIFPFPIYSLAFHGPKRHLLIGMEDEIMKIDGIDIFGDTIDIEIKELDNYDLLDDIIDPNLVAEQIVANKEAEAAKIIPMGEITIKSNKKSYAKLLKEYRMKQAKKLQIDVDDGSPQSSFSPIIRQRKIDLMLNLLGVEAEPEVSAKQKALENARAFIKSTKTANASMNTTIGNSFMNNVSVNTVEMKNQNSIKPKKAIKQKLTPTEFVKQTIDKENKKRKSRKKTSKKKRLEDANRKKKEEDNSLKKENQKNIFDLLNQKGRNSQPNPNRKASTIEIDISKMKFIECTTTNEENPIDAFDENSESENEDTETRASTKHKTGKNVKRGRVSSFSHTTNPRNKFKLDLNSKQSSATRSGKSINLSSRLSSMKRSTTNKPTTNKSMNKQFRIPRPTQKTNDKLNEKLNEKPILAMYTRQFVDDKGNVVNLTKKSIVNSAGQTIQMTHRQYINDQGEVCTLERGQYLDANGHIINLMNFEYIDENGNIIELPEGQFVNEHGQIVNSNGDFIDENGNIIKGDGYRYLDINGKIVEIPSQFVKEVRTYDYDNYLFIDEFGNVVGKQDTYVNEFGDFVDEFGEVLNRVKYHLDENGQRVCDNGFKISQDGQLRNKHGQRVNIKGEIMKSNKVSNYVNASSQYDNNYIRKVNAKIHRLQRFFKPSDRRYRPATPPPVRWNEVSTSSGSTPRRSRSRCKTPPPRKAVCHYNLPPPNYVLDYEAVLTIYGRGHTELLPLIGRLVREGAIDKSQIPIPSPRKEDDENVFKFKSSINHRKSPQENENATFEEKIEDHFKYNVDILLSPDDYQNFTFDPNEKEPVHEEQSFIVSREARISSKLSSISLSSSSSNTEVNNTEIEIDETDISESTIIEQSTNNKSESDKLDSINNKNHIITNKNKSQSHNNPSTVLNNNPKPKINQIKVEKHDTVTETESIFKVTEPNINNLDEDKSFSNNTIDTIHPIQSDICDFHTQATTEPEKTRNDFVPKPPSGNRHFNKSPIENTNIKITPPSTPNINTQIIKQINNEQERQQSHDQIVDNPPPKPPTTPKDAKKNPRISIKTNSITPSFNFSFCTLNPDLPDTKRYTPRKQKKKNEIKTKKVAENESLYLGVPTFRKDVKRKRINNRPGFHVDDSPPISIRKKFKPATNKQVDCSIRKRKLEATRSTRTIPESTTMARFYADPTPKTRPTKSIKDYTYLLEPGFREEGNIAGIKNDFSDKYDLLCSLQSLYPNTNQMMAVTPLK